MSGASVRLEHVRFSYGGPELVFDLAVESGERLALMGPSGSGKSTLLNLVAGFETPLSGRMLIDGSDVSALPASQRPVSMVFQENNLFAHLDVAANVGVGRSPSLRLTEEDRHSVERALQRTGLADKAKRLPGSLSGGERQRVALARVLVRERPVLLLDEAFAALGPALRDEMIDLVLELHAEKQMTIIDATHDPLEAERLGETVAFIDDGRVAASGRMTDFLAGEAPKAFRRYLGTGPRLRRIVDSARKPS